MANYGFVYILSNMAMPNIYKIGFTDRSPLKRAEELSNSTSCPSRFKVVCYGEMEEPHEVEAEIHSLYADDRVRQKREFFRFGLNKLLTDVCLTVEEYSTNFVKCLEMFELEIERQNILNGIKEEK